MRIWKTGKDILQDDDYKLVEDDYDRKIENEKLLMDTLL